MLSIRLFLCIILLGAIPSLAGGQGVTVFEEDWESGIGLWAPDNGVWEVGTPSVGPAAAHSGVNCAGTILGGNYPAGANTRLISPSIALPALAEGESILWKFWHWYRNSDGNGRVQISVSGGEWQTISDPLFDGTSNAWTQYVADLSAYADSTVRIAFFFNSGGLNSEAGWYVDDILIEKKVSAFSNPDDFELGVGDWSADNGLWEVGTPSVGPAATHSGVNCAGTILGGNYPAGANTRLISPSIALPALVEGESILCKFWHWYRNSDDNGRLQISVSEDEWQTISDPLFDGTSDVWTQYVADLSSYADSTVRIAFLFNSGGLNSESGWYVDDVSIQVGPVVFDIAVDSGGMPESFENGIGDWSADNGLWEVGVPEAGPDTGHTGENCAGTVLGGNYPAGANTCLISPEIELGPLGGQVPTLCFWHWYELSDDQGEVKLSVNGGPLQSVAGPYDGTSPVWTQACVELAAFADSTVRLAFCLTSGGLNSGTGWYLDDIRIHGIVSAIELAGFELLPGARSVTIVWRTGSETSHAGFNIHRAPGGGGEFQRVNKELIAGQGTRSRYEFTDTSVSAGRAYVYRLEAIDRLGKSELFPLGSVTIGASAAPRRLAIHAIYPNPARSFARVDFALSAAGPAMLRIYSADGRLVTSLLDEARAAGNHSLVWDGLDANGSRAPAGVYYARLEMGASVSAGRIVVVR